MSIDIVITWVDGNDPKWLDKKEKFSPNKKSIKTSNVKGRFRDNEELKYLLRSIEKNYFISNPNIFLVVDEQIPEWLDKNHVTIINHKDFIPKRYLPLFSSRAIESFFHKIPGVSDYFIYLNDDCFFSKKINKEDLFIEQKPIMHFELNKINIKYDISTENFANINAGILASKLVLKDYNTKFKNLTAHSPRLVDRDFIFKIENTYPEIFEKTRTGRFREYDSHSIISSLYPHLYIAENRGVVKFDDIFYMGNNDVNAKEKYKHLLENDYYGVCINDTSDNLSSEHIIFKEQKDFYLKKFPKKSKYEK
jgi:hypothetical protein